jgi:8-oxo-dGTP diphosphatase
MKTILRSLSGMKHATKELVASIGFDYVAVSEQLLKQAKLEKIDKIVVGGVIPNQDGRILLVQRAEGEKFMPNKWEFPSGHVDEGENLIDGLAREIKEETGYRGISILNYLDFFDYTSRKGKNVRQFNFLIAYPGTDPILEPKEHQSFAWCDIKKAIELGGDETVIDRFHNLQKYLDSGGSLVAPEIAERKTSV